MKSMAQAELGPVSDRTGIDNQINELIVKVDRLRYGETQGFDVTQGIEYVRELIQNTMTLSEMRVASALCYRQLYIAQWSFFRARSLRLLSNLLLAFRGGDTEPQGPRETYLDERILVISRLINILTDWKEKLQGSRMY